MSRQRIRVRTLMIAITVLAFVCYGEILRRRSAEYAQLCTSCRRLEMDCAFRVSVAGRGVAFVNERISEEGELPQWKEQLQWWSEQGEKNQKMAIHYRGVIEQFRAATRRPWVELPPQRAVPLADSLLPPTDLPLIFRADPKTNVRSPL